MSDSDRNADARHFFSSLLLLSVILGLFFISPALFWRRLSVIAAVALVLGLALVLIQIFVRWTWPAVYATVVGIVILVTIGLGLSFLLRSRENARSQVAQGNLRAIGAAHSSRAELKTLNQEPRHPERLSPSANDEPSAPSAEPSPTTDWTPTQLLTVLGSFVVLLALAVGGAVGWLLRWQARHSADTDDNEVTDLEPWEEPPAQPGAPLSS